MFSLVETSLTRKFFKFTEDVKGSFINLRGNRKVIIQLQNKQTNCTIFIQVSKDITIFSFQLLHIEVT